LFQKVIYNGVSVSVTSWDGQNHTEHWNNNHSNPLQMQNAHLVTGIYEMLIIQCETAPKTIQSTMVYF